MLRLRALSSADCFLQPSQLCCSCQRCTGCCGATLRQRQERGAKPLSQSDKPKIENSDQPFDGYDDVAEGAPEPHKHPVIPDTYKSGTGFRLTVLAMLLTVGLGAAFFLVSGIKAQDEAQLA